MPHHQSHLDAFHKNASLHCRIGDLPVGSKAIILSMHFKRALIVRLNGRATDGMHIYGTVLFPKGISPKGAEQKFDRVASALALPLTDAQANEYIAAAEAAVAHRSEAQKASHS